MAKKLTMKEKAYILAYTSSDSECFANAKRSYMKAYGITNESSAEVLGCKMLRRVRVKRYMEQLNEEFKLDMGKHIKALDEIITELIDKARARGSISVVELEKLTKPIRFLAEYDGKVGSNKGVNIAIQADKMGLFGDMSEELKRDLKGVKIRPEVLQTIDVIDPLKELEEHAMPKE